MYLSQLETLAHTYSAKLTVVIEGGNCSADWKIPGNRLERVSAYRPVDGVNTVLRGLLERLGRYRSVPTHASLLERMTPAQKVRLTKLLAELKELKREVLNPTPIHVLEPHLASPRSSLNPEHFNGFGIQQEVRDQGLASDAKRADYQARENKQ